VRLAGTMATLSRNQFDLCLQQNALASGAMFRDSLTVVAPLRDKNRITGAVLSDTKSGKVTEIRAEFTILATGASSEALEAFGVSQRKSPSAFALRLYLKAPTGTVIANNALCVSYQKSICPGYGWIVPGPNGVFNVGVGKVLNPSSGSRMNLRKQLEGFIMETTDAAAMLSPLGLIQMAFRNH
jgi:flavin-dependent dehydrogenase